MKQTKLFTKLFVSTLLITLFITLLAHELLFLFAPALSKSGTIFEGENTAMETVEDFPLLTEITFQADDYISGVIRKALPYSVCICCIVSFIFSYFFSKMVSAPIKRISEKTSEMAKLKKDIRCSENFCFEISMLSENINGLYESLFATIGNLENEKNKVSEAEGMKVDFLRSASHELKTPVTALNAILENMILGVGKYKNHDIYLHKCKEITEKLGEMICEILSTSKMNLFSEDEKLVETDLNILVSDLCVAYEAIAKSKGQIFKSSLENASSVMLRPNLFRKALSNVLTNAVLYTDGGKKISVSFNENRLIIENECIPIPKEHLKHIFEPFYRLDYSRDRNTGGNGLGLYLTAIILETLDISFEFLPSPMNDGMQFIISF